MPRRWNPSAGRTQEPMPRAPNPTRRAIYAVVARIPEGKVATYGQIASLAGCAGQARQVGYALAGIPDDLDLPWHRVINARGRVSVRRHTGFHELQQALLEREGVVFEAMRVDLARYLWRPRTAWLEQEPRRARPKRQPRRARLEQEPRRARPKS